jgi:hypothetical protein
VDEEKVVVVAAAVMVVVAAAAAAVRCVMASVPERLAMSPLGAAAAAAAAAATAAAVEELQHTVVGCRSRSRAPRWLRSVRSLSGAPPC